MRRSRVRQRDEEMVSGKFIQLHPGEEFYPIVTQEHVLRPAGLRRLTPITENPYSMPNIPNIENG